MSGWIKLHRSLKDWQWYDDHSATRLLIHLLVSVNHEDKTWKGQDLKAGQLVTSWENLSKETGLSVKQLRVAMTKLEASQEVTRYATNKWQVVSLVKWEKLQGCEPKEGKQKGRQRATTKEYKEDKKEIYIPSIEEFLAYALSKKPMSNKQELLHKYESWIENDWCTNTKGKNHKIENWKSTLLNTLKYISEVKNSVTPQIWE
jgi:hypothetical protein